MPLSDAQMRAILGLEPTSAPTSPTPSAPRVSARTTRSRITPEVGRRILGLPDAAPAATPEPEEEGSWVTRWAPTIARIGLPILGGAVGSVVPGPGTAAGAAIGAAAGAALGGAAGEAVAEKIEGRDLDPAEIALSAGLSAIPAGPAGRAAAELAKGGAKNLAKRALLHTAEGATQGVIGEAVRPAIMEGRLPEADELVRGGVVGGALGGVLGTGIDVAGRALHAPAEVPPPAVEVPPVDATVPPPVVDAAPPTIRRPSFLDEGLDPDLPPGPELGYGRGGVPVEPVPPIPEMAPLPGDAPERRAPVEGYRPAVARQPLEEPGITFTETTPRPRDLDRRQITEPTAAERRRANRRAKIAGELNLPAEHPAVQRIESAEIEARTDPLTGLMNKRGWEELQSTITPEDHVLVVDMRRLKPINDKLGHGAGDHAIRTFASVVREVFGDGDAARFGGDEMGAVLRGMNRQQAEQLVETFRQRAANHPTTLRNPQTGETLDIPGFEAHIGVGKSFDEADAAANAAAAASRTGGRGDVPIVPGGSNDPGGTPPVPAIPGPPGPGLGARPPELDAGQVDAGPPPVQAPDAPPTPALSGVPRSVGELDIRPGTADADVGGAVRDVPPTQPVVERRRFDREAAMARLTSVPSEALDLGGAAAKGAGVIRDLAEIGASYVEEYAQRNKGKLVAFESWARAAYAALKDVVPNIRKHLRQIYDQAVSLWQKTGVTFGSLPEEPRGVVMGSLGGSLQPPGPPPGPPPIPKGAKPRQVIKPIPPRPSVEAPAAPPAPPSAPPKPPGPVATEVTGRPVEPGETPRVEHRVEELRTAEKSADVVPEALDRETKQRWKDLDEPVKRILRDYDDEHFYRVMKSRNLDAAETMAWDARVKGKGERLEELRAKLRENAQDDVARRDLVAAELDFIAAQRASVNDGTGLARALAARARVMEGSRQPDDLFLRKVFRELPNVSDQQASDLIKAFRENPDNVQPLLHAAVGHGKLQKALELWKANMLSAFSTDIANFSGNAIEHHMQLAQTATSAGVDWLLQKVYGGNRARFAGEFGAEWGAGNQAFGPALKNLGKNLMNTVVKGKRKAIDLDRRLEYQTSALSPKGLGQYTSRVFGKLEVADQFFKEWGGGAELGKLAYRKAAKAGGTPEAIQKRAAKIMQEVADPANTGHADLMRAVKQAQDTRTFQERRHGSLTDTVNGLVRRHPLLQIPAPFTNTPGNIAARIIARSPLGAKRAMQAFNAFKDAAEKFEAGNLSAEEFAEARGQLADAIAGPLMGTAILAGFAGYAQAGGMTGGGPTDPKDKNALRDSGWQPYSFVLVNPATGKKTYVPYNRFEPVSSLLGFAADLVEAKDAKTGGDLFDKALGSVVENLSSKSYLQGIGDAASLISNPKQFAGQYVQNLSGSVVPNIIGRAASAVDPKFRDTRASSDGPLGILESTGKRIASRIPGVSTMLPERRSGTGEPIERPGNAVSRFLAPAPPSTEKEGGEFSRYLVEVDAVPSAPGRDIVARGKRVRLSEEEYSAIQDADAKTTARLRAALPRLRKMEGEKARNVIRSAYDQARATARRRVLSRPDFRKRLEVAS